MLCRIGCVRGWEAVREGGAAVEENSVGGGANESGQSEALKEGGMRVNMGCRGAGARLKTPPCR